MSLREKDVGISEFLGDHNPFRAILKQQLDDFIVNEIQPNGTIVYQKSRALPGSAAQENVNQKRVDAYSNDKKGVSAEDGPAEHNPIAPNYDVVDEIFTTVSPKPSERLKSLLLTQGTEYTFPSVTDKEQRTVLHNWVKKNLDMFVSDTVEAAEGGKAVRIRKRTLMRPWKRRRRGDTRDASSDASRTDTFDPRDSLPARRRAERAENDPFFVDRKTYVSFTLWKRGRDTNDALGIIAAVLRLSQNSLTHAGTKDKRAVTTQMIRLRGVPIRRLASVNSASAMFHRGRRCVGLGDFKILSGAENRPLSLGDLKGNRFTLVLRDVSISCDAERQNLLKSVESLQSHGFVNYYGLQRFGSGVSPTHETGYAVLRGDFKAACLRILTPLRVASVEGGTENVHVRPERKLMEEALQEFADGKSSAKILLEKLPNWMTIERTIAKSFAGDEEANVPLDYEAAFGKLPRNMKRMYGHAVQSYLWNCMASKRVSMFKAGNTCRRFAVAGDIIAVNTDAESFSFTTAVRRVTEAEEEARSIGIENVILPVIGSDVAPSDSETGQIAANILKREGVDMKRLPPEYEMKGTYRRLICKPENFEFSIQSYDSTDRRPLVLSNGAETKSTEMETDDANDVQTSQRKSSEISEQSRIGDRHALIVSFSLGCASYATMLTRELTRSETSTWHQKYMQQNLSS